MGSRDNRKSPKMCRRKGQAKKKAREERRRWAKAKVRGVKYRSGNRQAEDSASKASKQAEKKAKPEALTDLARKRAAEARRKAAEVAAEVEPQVVAESGRDRQETPAVPVCTVEPPEPQPRRVIVTPPPPESVPEPEPEPRIQIATAGSMPGKSDSLKERRFEVWSAIGVLDNQASGADLEEYLGQGDHTKDTIRNDLTALESNGWVRRFTQTRPIRYGQTDKRS